MLNNMEEKIYLLCSGGMIEAPEDWYKGLKESEFVDSYEGLLQGGYMHPSSEQIEFNLANPNLDLYNAFYMIPKDTTIVNEEIRKRRENLYGLCKVQRIWRGRESCSSISRMERSSRKNKTR